jgi:hypothetical protein
MEILKDYDKIKSHIRSLANKNGGASNLALVLHFSKLQEKNSSAHHIQIATNIIADLLKYNNIALALPDRDLIIFFSADEQHIIDRIIAQMHYFFSEDPLALNGNPNFSSVFLLKFQWLNFVSYLEEKLPDIFVIEPIELSESEAHHNDSLYKINNNLIGEKIFSFDSSLLLREQEVRLRVNNKFTKTLLRDFYYSMAYLKEMSLIDEEFFDNKIYYRMIKEELANKLILQDLTRIIRKPSNIHLTIDSIVSKPMLELIESLDKDICQSTVISFDIEDVFMDYQGAKEVVSYLKKKNFKLCLDVSSLELSDLLIRQDTGFDLIRVYISNLFDIRSINNIIHRHGVSRTIIAGCDDLQTLQSLSLTDALLLQGWIFRGAKSEKENEEYLYAENY